MSLFRTHRPCDPKSGILIFIQQSYNYIWYLNTQAIRRWRYTALLIHIKCAYTCAISAPYINVYPGLLNWYMMKWKVKPKLTVLCLNRLISSKHIVDYHKYATLVLSIPANHCQLNMSIFLRGEKIHIPQFDYHKDPWPPQMKSVNQLFSIVMFLRPRRDKRGMYGKMLIEQHHILPTDSPCTNFC